MVSPLENAINFFKEFGLFDVVLPFLLVFAVVFAILEKTRILGVEKIDNVEHPKKNLNAMVAFVAALMVISTNKVITALQIALPNIVLILFLIICFMLLVGSFYKTGEFELNKTSKWTKAFTALVFIGVLLIFANSMILDNGYSWLEYAFYYAADHFSETIVTSIIFTVIAIASIYFIVTPKQEKIPPLQRSAVEGEIEH